MTIAQLVCYAQAGSGVENSHAGLTREEAIALMKQKRSQRAADLAALEEALFDES